MGNTNGTRKRPAVTISQDEVMPPPVKRLKRDEDSHLSPSITSMSTSNTMTSEDSTSPRQRQKRRRRLAILSKFLSLSNGKIDNHTEGIRDRRSTFSLNEDSLRSGHYNMTQTVSLTSLSHRRDFPTPWLEALFLPSFPTRSPRSLSEKSFTFFEEIGRGTFGIVRRAQLKVLDRRICAIKMQDKSSVLIRGCAERAKQEVDIVRRLPSCPFIVHLYAAWQTRTRLFSCFEYPPDGCDDLFSIWKDCGTLSEMAVRIITAELGCALEFLHRNAIIYRDLKMENVIVDGEGHVKLTDFGMAKTLIDGERTRTVCGTLQYMAPEVSGELSEGYGHSIDWWSLAITAHVLLTGRYPYPNAECTHHSQLVYVDYSTPPGRSPEISILFDQMLHSKLEKRLHSFAELKSHSFFSSLIWEKVMERQYSLLPHIERCQRIARRRKKIREETMMKHEETDEECEDFEGFNEKYEFNEEAIE